MDQNKNTIQNYSTTPLGGLSKNLVHEMIDVYNGEPSYTLYRPHGFGNPDMDSRSIWFNLDTIKKFIWHIESLSKSSGLANMDKMGMRLYWGRYPSNPATWASIYPDLQSAPSNYNKLHTAFMIATYNDGFYNRDFDPHFLDANKIPRSINYIYDSISDKLNKTLAVLSADPNNSMQNHGTLIPPMQPTNYQGADLMQYADTH
jgi:hypothetical protein